METGGLLRRTRGGAVLTEGGAVDDPLTLRENKNVMQKQIIAGQAARYIKDGMTLFLDSSSTVYTLARGLGRFSGLRVVTNGVKTALLLSEMAGVTVMCTGGTLRENSQSLVGQAAVDYIARLNADLVFMSCRGFSLAGGALEATEEEYYVKRQYLQNSRRACLLCDSSKLDQPYLYRIAPLARFAAVITERRELNERMRAKGAEL